MGLPPKVCYHGCWNGYFDCCLLLASLVSDKILQLLLVAHIIAFGMDDI